MALLFFGARISAQKIKINGDEIDYRLLYVIANDSVLMNMTILKHNIGSLVRTGNFAYKNFVNRTS